uniref:Alpha-D-phosphohexomutase C-terminal domain-containing protein n=1 Tax=Cyclophora tenuis TaxID=216820 RepID=A0A7S1D7P3_CYCTE
MVVDCACGVGYAHVVRLNNTLQRMGAKRVLKACNGPEDGPLNVGCGSEHVQKGISPPKWYSDTPEAFYAASLDGDSDRIVFFSQVKDEFALLDGDKIAVLICDFLQQEVASLKKAVGDSLPPLRLGVVQTAYANGASTKYLKSVLGEENVLIAKTGVKHVHAAAHDAFDIGVYFEANGHGTVLFGDKFYSCLAHADTVARGNIALQRLQLLPALINQAVGDALCDLLLVDAILQLQQRDILQWNGLYQDLPSRQCKVQVEDRTMIKTNANETRCTSPPELQDELDKAMEAAGPGARCFVRPSGTENVVRVYAEAATSAETDALATKAASLVHSICAGIGTPPSFTSSNL